MIDGQVLVRWKIKDQFKKEHGKLFSGPMKTQSGLVSVAIRLKVRSSVSLVAIGCSSVCLSLSLPRLPVLRFSASPFRGQGAWRGDRTAQAINLLPSIILINN